MVDDAFCGFGRFVFFSRSPSPKKQVIQGIQIFGKQNQQVIQEIFGKYLVKMFPFFRPFLFASPKLGPMTGMTTGTSP